MEKIYEYATEALELSKSKSELEKKISKEIGSFVLISYESYDKSYRIHVDGHKELLKMSGILGINDNVEHTYLAGSDFPHKLEIKDEFSGNELIIHCYIEDVEYQNYQKEHIK